MLRGVALSAIVGVVLALASASSAMAAGGVVAGDIEVSHDGSSYGPALATPLFDGQPELVPLQEKSQTFWVRNATADDAYLTVMLDSPTWTSAPYGAALTIAASVPGKTGLPLPLSSTAGCPVLLEGRVLGAGQAVAVTATLALGDLGGTTGQGAHATMNVGVVLTEIAGLAARATCATPTVIVPVIADGALAGAPVPAAPVPATSVPATSVPATAEEPAAPEVPDGPLGPLALALSNTLGSFDAALVGWATLAVPVGAAVHFFAARLRRRATGDEGMSS